MPLTVVNGHNYVQMITLEPIRVRVCVFGLQPQPKDDLNRLVGPVDILFCVLLGVSLWLNVLKTKHLFDLVLCTEDGGAQFRLQATLELCHL